MLRSRLSIDIRLTECDKNTIIFVHVIVSTSCTLIDSGGGGEGLREGRWREGDR